MKYLNPDFEKLIEEKIAKNIEKGFDINQILLLLKSEYCSVCDALIPLQKRAMELSDQIHYIQGRYFNRKQED